MTSILPVVSILKTVIFGYMTHVLTIRPRHGITDISTMHRRIFALLYPCSGIGTAVGSMFKALFDDEILGISSYNSLLKSYDKEEKEKKKEEKEKEKEKEEKKEEEKEDYQTTPKTEASNLSILSIPSAQESEKDKANNAMISDSYKLRSRAIRLRDRLVTDQRAKDINIKEYDNSAYLAAFLHVLGPEKAKKTKHCILNGSLIIGHENEDKTLEDSYCLSDEITITGPGATCKYQKEIYGGSVRYLSTDMIDKLESAHNTDETSYIEICVTLGQIFFTTIGCMDIDGDRWAKVIMIIYTAMSVIQSVSLFMLHKQTTAFSIKDGNEILLEDGKYILTRIYDKDTHIYAGFIYHILATPISMVLGIIASLLIGIWADYNSHSITQWLVISWILSPIGLAVFYFILQLELSSIYVKVALYISCIPSAGCLIAATIIGYLPK